MSIPRSVIEAATKLAIFLNTGHTNANSVGNQVKELIYFHADHTRLAPADSSRRGASHSRKSREPLHEYPIEWTTSRRVLDQAIDAFIHSVPYVSQDTDTPASPLVEPATRDSSQNFPRAPARQERDRSRSVPGSFPRPQQSPTPSLASTVLETIHSDPQGDAIPRHSAPASTRATSMDQQGGSSSSGARASSFTAQQRADMMQMFSDLLDTREARHGARNPPNPPNVPSIAMEQNLSVKPADIGYFYPNMPRDWGTADITEKDGRTYYRNVFSFTNRVRVAAQTRDPSRIKATLDACLRGEAELWWTTQLTTVLRAGLIAMAGVEDYCKALEIRFRPPPSEAFAKYNTTRYSVEDCRNRRSVTEYLATLESAAKGCGQGPAPDDTAKYGLVIQAWMHLDLALRESVDEPSPDTTLDQFASTLLRKQSNWFDRFPPQSYRNTTHAMASSRGFGRSHFYQPGRSSQFSNTSQFLSTRPGQYQSNTTWNGAGNGRNWARPAGQNNANYQQTSYQFKAPLTQRGNEQKQNLFQQQRQPLAITAPQNASGSSTNYPGSQYQRDDARLHKPYMQRAYLGTTNEVERHHENTQYEPRGEANEGSKDWELATQHVEEGDNLYEGAFQQEYMDEPMPYYNEYGNEHSGEDNANVSGYFTSAKTADALQMNTRSRTKAAPPTTPQSECPAPSPPKKLSKLPDSPLYECKNCSKDFPSRNKLFKHLKACKSARHAPPNSDTNPNVTEPRRDLPERASVAPPIDIGMGMGYRGYTYAVVQLRLKSDAQTSSACFDTGCSASLIDRAFLKKQLPDVEIRTMARPLKVRGIADNEHSTSDYAILTLRIPGRDLKTRGEFEALVTREMHIVDKLDANMLIGTDIMVPEKMDLILSAKKLRIGSCNVEALIQVRVRAAYHRHHLPLHVKSTTIVPPNSISTLPIHSIATLANGRDLLFEPDQLESLSLFAHIVDKSVTEILVKNNTPQPITLHRNTRLGYLQEIGTEQGLVASAFTGTTSSPVELAERPPRAPVRPGWFKKGVAMLAACTKMSPTFKSDYPNQPVNAVPLGSPLAVTYQATPETVLPNGVTIFGAEGTSQVKLFTNLVSEFPTLWQDTGRFVDLPQEEWMRIPLKTDWESRLPTKGARVYPLGLDSRDVVDKTFDGLHEQGRMSWTSFGTPFSHPVFVVWKTMPNGERSGRAVVDIRPLNQMGLADVYPIPLQSDIIGAVQGCPYITVVDCASFFYQWRVHPEDRHKLTVVSHRGQETFNVVVMGYKNSVSYVQRQIDKILRPYPFAKAFVDDVVIASKTFEEHVHHLRVLFRVFSDKGISIKPSKAYIGYPSVRLLGQHVDSLGLATAEEKLAAIANIRFPRTLKDLECYLGMTGWLRQYVPHYAAITEPLQQRKTALLKSGPAAGPARKNYSRRTALEEPTEQELAAFETLQKLLAKPTYLVHFNPSRRLFVDLDASKAFGFGAVVYHVKGDDVDNDKKAAMQPAVKYPNRTDIEPIMFLSRMLSPAEKNYWPTELEIAGLVWVIRKIRHLIESCRMPVRAYTDHGATPVIATQKTLETTSAERSNLRLVRASEYIQRFNIDIYHKPGKTMAVPDALSRLASTSPPEISAELDFANAYNYTATLVEMSADFKNKLLEGYQKDPAFRNILEVLKANDALDTAIAADPSVTTPRVTNKASLPFSIDTTGLLWHESDTARLCIPEGLVKEVLTVAHTQAGHPGVARTFERAANSWYIRHLGRHVRNFIRYCPECQIYQIRRHQPNGSMQPVESPPVPFHTITIDFILALPLSAERYNCAMSITDKFSKRITLVPGQDTWNASQWAHAMLERLWLADWGLPKVIISDRDRKFLSSFWHALFTKLGVRLFYSTAYHPQTDGQSERTNQTVEAMLRVYIGGLTSEEAWPHCLSQIQSVLNNSSTNSGKSPNDIVYGFTPNFAFDWTTVPDINMPAARIEASDALDYAAMNMKKYYDRKHTAVFFAVGDWVLLRLHKGYSIPTATNKKLHQQYAGPFQITHKVGRLAYRLKIPNHWRIHDVFTVAMLERASPPGKDPYNRPVPDEPPAVIADQEMYEVERLLSKRVIKKGKGESTQYLVRWKGYGPEHDRWFRVQDLWHCTNLVEQYESRALPGMDPFGV